MSQTVEEYLAGYTPEVSALAARLREIVLATLPDVTEVVHVGYKNIIYSAGTKMSEQICHISAHKDSANLGFIKGAVLPDPKGLLTGTGKMLRHVKVKKMQDIDEAAIKALLETALKAT